MPHNIKFRHLFILIIICTLIVIPITHAQDQITLTVDTPVSVELSTPDSIVTVQYEVLEDQVVIFQAMSDMIHPNLKILENGVEIAKYRPAQTTTASINLPAYLKTGTYTLQISALNEFGNPARVLVGITAQNPLTSQYLGYGETAQDTITSDHPARLHQFDGVAEQSQLIVNMTPVGARVRVTNAQTGETWLNLSPESIGGRLYLPPTESSYHVSIVSDVTQPVSYTLCYVSIFADCGTNSVSVPPATEPVPTHACTATPLLAGGANIRQSASVESSIIGALAGGQSVPVIGIDPTGTWYQVEFNTQTGWASLSAVSGQGNCEGLPTVTPPVFATVPPSAPTDVPTTEMATATPTETSSLPTASATATFTATVTLIPSATPTATVTQGLNLPVITAVLVTLVPPPINDCTVTFTGDEFIYTIPNPIVDYLLHQMSSGQSTRVLGRLNSDPNWLKINYYDGWWYSGGGANGTLSGDCANLPSVSP